MPTFRPPLVSCLLFSFFFVFSDKKVRAVPGTAEASSALRGLLPHLFYHNLSEDGLESFAVVEKSSDKTDPLGSAAVWSLPFHPSR